MFEEVQVIKSKKHSCCLKIEEERNPNPEWKIIKLIKNYNDKITFLDSFYSLMH